MPSSPNWKLRRIADRVLRVHARRSPSNPALEAFGATLLPKVNAYIAAYDEARNSEASWKKEMREGKGAVASLVTKLRAWLPSFTRDVAGFNASDFADKPDVPDDVLADASRLLEAAAAQSPAPAWAASFTADLTPALNAAVTEWHQAEAADSAYQQTLKKVRETGANFDAELQLYRVSLAAVLGTNDKDFQKLRAERATQKDDEDTSPLAGGDNAGGAVKPGDPPKPN